MKSGGKLLAALVVAVGLAVPATASADVTVTLTGDDGQPAPIAVGAAPTIRNLTPTAAVQVSPPKSGDSWAWWVTAPDGALAVQNYCWSTLSSDSSRVNFRGNGTYTLHMQYYTGSGCKTPNGGDNVYSFNIAGSVGITPPAGPLMTRPANSVITNTHLIGFTGVPGNVLYDIHFAKNAALAPDGSISGPSKTAVLDSATGAIRFWDFDGPGTYTFVARAQAGDYFTPWSPPVTVTLVAPFDLSSVSFPDSRGPSYKLRGVVREAAGLAGKKVTIAYAKGKKGKRFHTLGKVKVNSKGVFTKRFRLSRGTYRMRYSFSGNASVTRGTVYEVITIRRIIG